jgi:hypothetical protein
MVFPHWNMEYKGRSLRTRNSLGHVDYLLSVTLNVSASVIPVRQLYFSGTISLLYLNIEILAVFGAIV